jgi:tape measure domain-containing protein
MTVGQVIAKLGVDPKEYEKGLKKAEAQADKAGLKIGNIFKNAFSVTLGMGMFEALKKGFKSTVGTAISFNSMLQTAQIGFATMLGSAEKAQAFLDDMADFAAKTPFEYPELLEAAKRMLAYGFAAENVLPTLRAVGDATAALGMGSEGIDRVTLALGQILAKGKLSGEEMRQLTEAGVPAWHILADAMGKTVPELQDMVSKGLVPGGKAVDMLTAGMTKRFGGMMASMEDTWQGVTSSIKDIWRMTVGTLTQTLFGGLNAMLIKVRDFLSQFYSMLNAVMGKKAKQATDGLVQSTQEQASAMVDVGDATEEAAKKAKKNLQTFDEVHQLQEDMSDTAAGDMFAMPETGAMAPFEMEDAGEPETFTKMQETLEKLAILFDPAIEGFNRLKTAAEPVITSIGEGLKWFYDNILVPFGTWVMTEAVPAFFNLLTGTFTVLNPLLQAFAPLGEWLWTNFLQPIAAWTGDAFVASINLVADALASIGNWMSENKSTVEGMAIAIAAFFAAWKLTELMAFIQMSGGLIGAINAITTAIKAGIVAKLADKAETIALTALYAKDFVVSLAKSTAALVANAAKWVANTAAVVANKVALVAAKVAQVAMTAATVAWNAVCGVATTLTTAFGAAMAFLTSPIGLVVLAIGAVIAIVILLVKYWDEVSAAAVSAWEWIKSTWQVVAEWFDTNIIQPLADFFTGLWDGIKQLASDAWSGIVEIWQTVSEWFNTNVIQPVAKFFAGLWDGIKEAASNAWDGIVEAWNAATSWFDTNIIQPLVNFFTNLWDGIKQLANDAWNGIVEIWQVVSGWFDTNIIQPIAQFFIDLWEGIKEVWNKAAGWFDTHVIQPLVGVFNDLKTGIIDIWDGIWGGIKSVVNSIIGGINILISGLNQIHFDVPDWVPGIGGKGFGISIPLIPKLATGTNYIPQDMFAYLHEGEAVVPKKYNPDATGLTAETLEQAVYRAFMNALRIMQASAKQDDKELVLKIDNTTLARMQLPAIIREGQRQGLNLVVQGV